MPNRVIKESIRTSRSVNTLTDFQFRMWVYLITYVDDYGRGSADVDILKGFVFPKRKNVTEAQILRTLDELATIGMIHLYEVDGEPFFCFPTWDKHQRIQTKKSRFPDPCESTVTHRDPPPESNPNPNTNPNPKENTPACAELPFDGILLDAVNDWLAYKQERRENYKPTGLKTLIGQIKRAADAHGDAAVAEVIRTSMASNYQGIVLDRLNKPAAASKRRQPEFNRDQDMDNDDLGLLIASTRKES